MSGLVVPIKDNNDAINESKMDIPRSTPLPSSFVRASAAPQPQASWFVLLKQELRREERWSWVPVPPRKRLINSKGQDHSKPSLQFLLFRWGALLYWSVWLTLSVVSSAKGVNLPVTLQDYHYGILWLIYATSWTAILLWIYLLLACLALILSSRSTISDYGIEQQSKTTSCVGVLTWIARDAVAPAAVMVTILYWSLLFPLFGYTTFVDVHLHLINAVIILADLWLSRLPYWLLHFPAPLTFLCAYVFFAAIYYVTGGYAPGHKDYIYPWLDFGRLDVTIPIILLVVFVIFPAVHACLWLFERAARQRTMAREKGEARQRIHALVVDSERESKMEQGEIKPGRAQQEELSYQFAEDEAKSESAQVHHTMDQCQDHHERNEPYQVYFDAVSPSEGSYWEGSSWHK